MDKVDNKPELLTQFLKKKRQLQETQKTCPVAIAVFDEKNQLITVEFDSGNISWDLKYFISCIWNKYTTYVKNCGINFFVLIR